MSYILLPERGQNRVHNRVYGYVAVAVRYKRIGSGDAHSEQLYSASVGKAVYIVAAAC